MKNASIKYAVELDGAIYRFSDGRLEKMETLEDVTGDRWIVSDLQEPVSGMMTVDAGIRYAEIIAQKKLHESGEFDEPVTVIAHWKQKKGKTATELFYTAFPSHLSGHYISPEEDEESSVLLFPLYSVLLGTLKRMRPRRPVAVVFQHGRYADLIVGSKTKIYSANRCVAYDSADEQLEDLWESITEDIQAVANSNRIKVDKAYVLNWIDSAAMPRLPDEAGLIFLSLPGKPVRYNGKSYQISFIRAVEKMSGAESEAPAAEKVIYYAGRCVGWLNLAFASLALLLFGGYYYLQTQTARIDSQAAKLDQDIAAIHFEQPAVVDPIKLKQTVTLINDLFVFRKAPSYKHIINDISDSIFSDMKLDVLKVDYRDNEVQVEVFGRIEAPFSRAHIGYQNFLTRLGQEGYTVVENQFDTEIEYSEFLLKFNKRI